MGVATRMGVVKLVQGVIIEWLNCELHTVWRVEEKEEEEEEEKEEEEGNKKVKLFYFNKANG